MRAELLTLLGAGLLTLGCGDEQVKIVHLSDLAPEASHDTLIRYSAGSKGQDTFVMHLAASAPDSCLKVPKPPGCPDYLKALKIDTIPRP